LRRSVDGDTKRPVAKYKDLAEPFTGLDVSANLRRPLRPVDLEVFATSFEDLDHALQCLVLGLVLSPAMHLKKYRISYYLPIRSDEIVMNFTKKRLSIHRSVDSLRQDLNYDIAPENSAKSLIILI